MRRKLSVVCMKQKINFATWWRHFSGQSIKISTTNIAPPCGEIKFLFHRSEPALSHAKNFGYLYPSGQSQ